MFPHFEQMKDAMVLRNSLAPYIYTAAAQHYDLGISLLRPLYYEHPEDDDAYTWADTQYYFGDSMLIAPIATAGSSPDPYTGVTHKQMWVPPGTWVEWGGELTHVGPVILSKNYTLSEIPMLVSAGAVVPLKTMASVSAARPDPLVWAIFVPSSVGCSSSQTDLDSDDSASDSDSAAAVCECAGTGEVYEDDGETRAYETNPGERLMLEYSGDWANTVVVKITPPSEPEAEPKSALLAAPEGGSSRSSRGHVLQLRGLQQHQDRTLAGVSLRVGGAAAAEPVELARHSDTAEAVEDRAGLAAAAGWWTHTGHSLSTPRGSVVVDLGQQPKAEAIEVTLRFSAGAM